MGADRPRALLVSQPTTGGAGACVADLAAAAVRDGWQVVVASPEGGDLPAAASAAGARWRPLDMQRGVHAADLRLLRTLRRWSAEADVVHLHASTAGALGRIALVGRGARPGCVFTPHGWSWLADGAPPGTTALERSLVGLADAVVAVSEAEGAEGVARLGARLERRLRCIPNGVDVDRFHPDGPPIAPAPGRGPLVVVVGRLAGVKGPDVAVRGLAALGRRDVRLRLVGDGPERDALASLAAGEGVAERVEMVGDVADPRPHLWAADVVVVPSRRDAMSMALLEAMACGRPVVATAVAGVEALGDTGVVVPPDDPPALAAALEHLLGQPAERLSLGRAARRRVVEAYPLRLNLDRNLALWHEVRRSRPGSPSP